MRDVTAGSSQAAGGGPTQRFVLLDGVRAVAALAVIVYHWGHFDAAHNGTVSLDPTKYPFFALLEPAYTHGRYAVDLFFMLSGFIFFYFFADRIRGGALGAREFALRRFSRLYPLYALTLVLSALGQWAYRMRFGQVFNADSVNSAGMFILSLLGVQNWGMTQVFSFNRPAWSLSVEFFLYVVFFVFARKFGRSLVPTLLVVIVGLAATAVWQIPLARGVGAFFIGGVIVAVFSRITTRCSRVALTRLTLFMALAVVTLWVTSLSSGLLSAGLHGALDGLVLILVLFPTTIGTMALVDYTYPRRSAVLEWFGGISYSMYLWHFPLQLLVAYFVMLWTPSGAIYYAQWALPVFLVAVMGLSTASYYGFELPTQRWLRSLGGHIWMDGRV